MFTLTKNTLCTLALFTLMHCAPLHAQYDDTELRNRVSALESRVDALEGHSPSVELRDIDLTVDHGQSYLVLPSQLFDGEAVITAVDGAELRAGSVVTIAAETESFTYHVGSQSATVTINRSGIPHHGDPRHDEHMALHAKVVDRQAATVVAVKDGKWHDPTVWNTGVIPSDGDKVLIHGTIDVLYDAHSDAILDWVRVDGGLSFSGGNRLVVETLVGTSGSRLNIGSAESPIPDDAPVEIVIDTAGGPLDMEADPKLLSRGVIVHGSTRIYGEAKTPHVSLHEDVHAGDDTLSLAAIPNNWRAGDTIIIASTEGDTDEFRVIESIDGQAVSLTEPLAHNHTRPSGEYFTADELEIHVANITRSIRFSTTNPNAPPQERAHFMVMHSKDTVLDSFSVEGFGRTDKSKLIDDVPGNSVNGSESFGTNPRGRYGIHLHRTGNESNPVTVSGCVVMGSPGWGIVHHNSSANLIDNIVYDAFGACFIVEGDPDPMGARETGAWSNNLAIRSRSGGHNDFDDNQFFGENGRAELFDMGFFGTGFWLQGGAIGVKLDSNIAVNVNTGCDVFHALDRINRTRVKVSDLENGRVQNRFLADGLENYKLPLRNIPNKDIEGMVVYNSNRPFHTWLHNRQNDFINKDHDLRAFVSDFKCWHVNHGIQTFYSSQFTFENGLLVGDPENPVPYKSSWQANNTRGIGATTNLFEGHDYRYHDVIIEGFEYGIQAFGSDTKHGNTVRSAATSFDGMKFGNVRRAFKANSGPEARNIRFPKVLVLKDIEVSAVDTGPPPTASFTYEALPEKAVLLDGSASFTNNGGDVVGNGIVAYRWAIQDPSKQEPVELFGEQVAYVFDQIGEYTVTLTVWDDLGKTEEVTEAVTADNDSTEVLVEFPESIKGFNLEGWSPINGEGINHKFAGQWYGYQYALSDELRLQSSNSNQRSYAGRVVSSKWLNRGIKTLDVTSQGAGTIEVWGINGAWREGWFKKGNDPKPIGATDVQIDLLLQEKLEDTGDRQFSVDIAEGYEYVYLKVWAGTGEMTVQQLQLY